MEPLYEYLQQLAENVPAWLDDFNEGDSFEREKFFSSRILYYPGSGTDGQPVKLFGSTHCVHTFVYVDQAMPQASLEAELENPVRQFQGYHTLARLRLAENDLVPQGWIAHLEPGEIEPNELQFPTVPPFGFCEILQRNPELDDDHGARRLAVLFLGADGFAAYDALFCQADNINPPFVVVLQDHGFDGNYNQFGQGGLLETIANRCDVLPHWLLVADNTNPWAGYQRLENVDGDIGGMGQHRRFLYERSESEL